jgi:nicotinamidase-related amidase
MRGTKAAEIIPALKAEKEDTVLPKQTYSAFYETSLDSVLRAHEVDALVITGLHSNICCRHTSADAFFRGIKPILPEDGVDSLTQEAHASGLEYIRTMYQGDIVNTEKVLKRWK